jgi:hypothetical protein
MTDLEKLNGLSDSELYNLNLIPLELSEKIKNRVCFYKSEEYKITLEEGKLVLEIYEKQEKEFYEI